MAQAAATLITGKQIKDDTVTSADVRDRSLLARDFKRVSCHAGSAAPRVLRVRG